MFNHTWKKELLTIPNFLSLIRLLLIPVYINIYQRATQPIDYILAGSVLAISCLTDFADGKSPENSTWYPRPGNCWIRWQTK